MSTPSEADKRVVTIKRSFQAPVETVWEAWTSPEHITGWWAPKGMSVAIVEHDFKVGGKWKYTMPMPDGTEFVSEGVYLEIIQHEKIVTTADFRPMTTGVEIHAIFSATGNTTDFTFYIVHPTEEYRIQQENMGMLNGWGSVFTRLEQVIGILMK